jgi:hypothetical protein
MPVDAEAGVDGVYSLPEAVESCAPRAHVLFSALDGRAAEAHLLARTDLPQVIERERRDDGQNGVTGGDTAPAVQHEEFVAGRNLHSTDGNTARDHLLGTAADG